jgi:hypothetical protein
VNKLSVFQLYGIISGKLTHISWRIFELYSEHGLYEEMGRSNGKRSKDERDNNYRKKSLGVDLRAICEDAILCHGHLDQKYKISAFVFVTAHSLG